MLGELGAAFRSLRRRPAFVPLVVLTLALGIGANTAVFSIIDAVLLRPLDVDPDGRLMRIFNVWPSGIDTGSQSVPQWRDVRERSDVFDSYALFYTWQGANFSAGAGEPEFVDVLRATASLFDVLRVRPAIGRAFDERSDRDGGPRVVVLSHELFERRFAADPAVVGTTIRLEEGEPYTVIGVLPAELAFPRTGIDLWLPARFNPQTWENRGNHSYSGIGRLRDRVSVEASQRSIVDVGSSLRSDHEGSYPPGWSMRAESYREFAVGRYRTGLLLILGVVAVVLLIACGNVAHLLLARGAARSRELAIRGALGASGWRVLRQLFAEAGLLSLAGAAGGCALAVALLRLRSAVPLDVPGLERASFDVRVFSFSFVVTLLTTLLVGLLPAMAAVRADLVNDLRERSGGARAHRLRGALVFGEAALAAAVIIGAGLLMASLIELQRVDLGFEPSGRATARLSLHSGNHTGTDGLRSAISRILSELEQRPEISVAAVANAPPLGGFDTDRWIWVEGHSPLEPGERLSVQFRTVSPSYFELLGIDSLDGRLLAYGDDAHAPLVCVISESMAREFWPGRNPVGARLKLGVDADSKNPWLAVVGVVADVRDSPEAEVRSTIYLPFDQQPLRILSLLAAGALSPEILGRVLQETVLEVDPQQPLYDVVPYQERVESALAQPRFNTWTVSSFSLLALLLAAIGTFGVVSTSVRERRRELGVSIALGAHFRHVIAIAFGRELWLVAAGLGLGLGGALIATRLLAPMSELLFRVEVFDPRVIAGAVTLLLAAAVAACWGPALRAQAVDPIVTLREE